MRYPQLDERLIAAAELFSACEIGADIGAKVTGGKEICCGLQPLIQLRVTHYSK